MVNSGPHGTKHAPNLFGHQSYKRQAPQKEECPMHNVFYLIGLIVVVLAIISFVF